MAKKVKINKKPKKKELKIPTYLVKADVFLKHAGIVSVGGDAVKGSMAL